MRLFKDLLVTVLFGASLAGGGLALFSHLRLSVPEPHQKPIFFVGVVLFSIAFRLLISLKEEG